LLRAKITYGLPGNPAKRIRWSIQFVYNLPQTCRRQFLFLTKKIVQSILLKPQVAFCRLGNGPKTLQACRPDMLPPVSDIAPSDMRWNQTPTHCSRFHRRPKPRRSTRAQSQFQVERTGGCRLFVRGSDLPPESVHSSIRQLTSICSPVLAGIGVGARGRRLRSLAPPQHCIDPQRG